MNIEKIVQWYAQKRRPLPWRTTHDPYRIWVSEIFLQQTQVARVIDFYTRFLEKFPSVFHLANASWEQFLPYFQGLGFYNRGRNMLQTAQIIVKNHNGIFPNDKKILKTLPGIGDYTASAICSFAYGQSIPALDVNLFRVLGRVWNLHEKQQQKQIAEKATLLYQTTHQGALLNHAFMDLGSWLCLAKKVQCSECPLRIECAFYTTKQVLETSLAPKPPMQKYQEYAVMILRHDKKVMLYQQQEKLIFPEFYNEKKQDIRHFLKEKAKELWNIEISVRPAFFTVVQNKKRFQFCRCQILQGNPPSEKWIRPKQCEKKDFENIYSSAFFEKWQNMLP